MKIQVVLVLIWTTCCHFVTLYSSGHLVFTQLAMNDDLVYFGLMLFMIQAFCFALYPVMGLVAEVCCTRYKTMLIGTFLQLFGTLLFVATSFVLLFQPDNGLSAIVFYIVLIPYALIQVGLGMIESNIIQFGTDQIIDRPSVELSSFVHWYFWAIFVGHGIIDCLFLVMIPSTSSLAQGSGIVLIIMSLLQATTCIGILFIVICKTVKFDIEPLGENPVKLIKNVLTYAYHHPFPVNQSAFTYNDEKITRLDYAKTRFGGPFLTEEVEDVKAFFRVVLVFLSLLGFHFTDETQTISKKILSMYNEINATLPVSEQPWFHFLTIDGFGVSTFTILIGIPVYQLLIIRGGICVRRFLPSMLKRMFIGLVCVNIAVVSILVMNSLLMFPDQNYADCNHSCSYYEYDSQRSINYNLLIIPQVFNGLGFLFVFLSVMEFVLAQAPRRMQGLLIGIWYSFLSINLILAAIESTLVSLSSDIIPYLLIVIRISLMIVGLVTFPCVATKYKRRLRNELADVNIHLTIEKYTERQLQTDEELKEQDQMNIDYVEVVDIV